MTLIFLKPPVLLTRPEFHMLGRPIKLLYRVKNRVNKWVNEITNLPKPPFYKGLPNCMSVRFPSPALWIS